MPSTLDLKNAKTGMGLYQSSPVTLTDGDYIPPLVDSQGRLYEPDQNKAITVWPAGTVLAANGATTSADQTNLWYRTAFFFLNISAITGNTVTFDIKLQAKDATSGVYKDIPLYVFVQSTVAQGAQTRMMVIQPAGTAVAGALVLGTLPLTWTAVATVGSVATPSVTFSLSAVLIR